ncbi:hypothetical protein N752_18635 [Desulforamulus aquiferis]|nr:hypothetical protein [Desulforamulus aquiferis]RYD03765.1 hypothetical protein N752_18635 [Desulforamulus aquiferis]
MSEECNFGCSFKKGSPIDICVPVVFGIHRQVGKNAFKDTNIFAFPSSICQVECENVEVIKRSIAFECDKVLLSVDYIISLKIFPKVGAPYCKTFQSCFVKEIKHREFCSTLKYGKPVSLKDFQKAQVPVLR